MHDPTAELETYRTLRLGLAAGGLLLGLALIWLIGLPEVTVPRSVSATYYSPIENVFVGSLIAVGLAMVAVKGRPGWENGLLDVAGVLIPLVALVPTPIKDQSCLPAGADCVPLDLVQGVELNVGAYLTLGLIALGYLWIRRWRAGGTGKPWEAPTTSGLGALTALWLLVLAVFVLARPVFLQYTHYAAAIAFFAILIAVVWINARRSTAEAAALARPESWYRRWYLGIAIAMLGLVLAGVALFLATGSQNAVITATPTAPIPVVFWVEVCLLALFIWYWALQTVELWNHTVPPS